MIKCKYFFTISGSVLIRIGIIPVKMLLQRWQQRNTFLLTTMHNSLLLKKKDSPNFKGKDLHGSYNHGERKNTLNALLRNQWLLIIK